MLRGRWRKNTIIISSDKIRDVIEIIYPHLEGSGIKFLHGPSTLLCGDSCETRPPSSSYNICTQSAFLPRQTAWTRPGNIKANSWVPAPLKLSGGRRVAQPTFEEVTRGNIKEKPWVPAPLKLSGPDFDAVTLAAAGFVAVAEN